jgi:hypothetical protein
MARKLAVESEQLTVPPWLVDAVDRDPTAGVSAVVDLIGAIREHGGFAGAHIIGVSRYRQLAARLEAAGWSTTARVRGAGSR